MSIVAGAAWEGVHAWPESRRWVGPTGPTGETVAERDDDSNGVCCCCRGAARSEQKLLESQHQKRESAYLCAGWHLVQSSLGMTADSCTTHLRTTATRRNSLAAAAVRLEVNRNYWKANIRNRSLHTSAR